MAAQSSLYAFNFGETLKWEYPTNNSGIISSPAISSDGAIYFGCDYGHLYALNSDGTLRWRYQTGGAIQSSPAIAADGMIYFGSDTVIYMLSMV
ncbi:MAG: PQQ-binding-like beta-propeller repeat protein [candidate division WOR-3 bacterium]|nr:PQQ-binding-like beta-propeller repeat protein [candidate division WOR-3 bacterium]